MRGERQIDEAVLQICADLVRYVDASHRTQLQTILSRLLTLPPRRPHSQKDAVELLATVLSGILQEISPRQRTILERCDVHRESARVVAQSLGISRRHLYRERHAALSWIALRLTEGATTLPQVIAIEGGRCSDQVAVSQLLENGGDWRSAADVLEKLADELDDPDQRSLIEIRLGYLYLRADRPTMARDHSEIAKRLAHRSRAGREWREAEADVLSASIALSVWDMRMAAQLAHRSVAQLESWANGTREIRIHNALANALMIEADVVLARGDIELARALGSRAREITSNDRIDVRTRIEVRANMAALDIFIGRRPAEAERELKDCYRQALLLGLTNTAIGTAAELAGTYRRQGRPEAAIDLLRSLANVSGLTTRREYKKLLYQLSNAYIEIGELGAAGVQVRALTEAVSGLAARQGPAQLTLARFHLAARSWAPALLAAETAETSYAQLGSDRMVGESLILQVQALLGLGESLRARRLMTATLKLVETTNSEGRLAIAYNLMARVSGQSKYATARRVLRDIHIGP